MEMYADNEVLDIVVALLSQADDATLSGLLIAQADRATEDVTAIILAEAARRLGKRDA